MEEYSWKEMYRNNYKKNEKLQTQETTCICIYIEYSDLHASQPGAWRLNRI
jgi:hypothetical protein